MSERHVATCNGPNCGAEIRWCKGSRGGNVPLDVEPTPAGEWVIEDEDSPKPKAIHLPAAQREAYTGPKYNVHWGTCPDRDHFKKQKKRR